MEPWDGLSDLGEYPLSKRSINQREEVEYERMHVYIAGAPYNPNRLGSSYVDKLLLRAEGFNIAAMLEFLFAEVPVTRTQLSPELFVLHSRLHLLEWAVCRQGHIDLHCPASRYPQLLQCVASQPWYKAPQPAGQPAGSATNEFRDQFVQFVNCMMVLLNEVLCLQQRRCTVIFSSILILSTFAERFIDCTDSDSHSCAQCEAPQRSICLTVGASTDHVIC